MDEFKDRRFPLDKAIKKQEADANSDEARHEARAKLWAMHGDDREEFIIKNPQFMRWLHGESWEDAHKPESGGAVPDPAATIGNAVEDEAIEKINAQFEENRPRVTVEKGTESYSFRIDEEHYSDFVAAMGKVKKEEERQKRFDDTVTRLFAELNLSEELNKHPYTVDMKFSENPKTNVADEIGKVTDKIAEVWNKEFLAPLSEPFGEDDFATELKELINHYSRENISNTPDFILSGFMEACLIAFENATNARHEWYNGDPVKTDFANDKTQERPREAPYQSAEDFDNERDGDMKPRTSEDLKIRELKVENEQLREEVKRKTKVLNALGATKPEPKKYIRFEDDGNRLQVTTHGFTHHEVVGILEIHKVKFIKDGLKNFIQDA